MSFLSGTDLCAAFCFSPAFSIDIGRNFTIIMVAEYGDFTLFYSNPVCKYGCDAAKEVIDT